MISKILRKIIPALILSAFVAGWAWLYFQTRPKSQDDTW